MRIAISGKMASGKTTLANYLVKEYGFEPMSLATPLKELEAIHANGPSGDLHDVWHIADKISCAAGLHDGAADVARAITEAFRMFEPTPGIKNRPLLQYLGTEVIRNNFGDNVWANYLVNEVDSDLVVVDDVRFKSEFNILKSQGFIMIRLEVSPDVQWGRLVKLYPDITKDKLQHKSEIDLDDWLDKFDRIINNDTNLSGTLKEMDRLVIENRREAS